MTLALGFALALSTPPAAAQWLQIGFLTDGTTQVPTQVSLLDPVGGWAADLRVVASPDGYCAMAPAEFIRGKGDVGLLLRWTAGGSDFEQTVARPSWPLTQVLIESREAPPSPAGKQPSTFARLRVSPNPFNPLTTVSLALPQDDRLQIRLYDLLGRQVAVLADGPLPAGEHRWVVDGSSLATGTYFLAYHLTSGPTGVQRLLLLK